MLRSQSIIQSETLTPSNSSINGASINSNSQEVQINDNNEWNVSILSQNNWQFILSLDKTWGFHPYLQSIIEVSINSSTISSIHTFDDLVFGFTVNNDNYFSVWIPMLNNAQNNEIYPACDTSDIPTQQFHTGDIAEIPDTDRMCDIAAGKCSHWRQMEPKNAQGANILQYNTFPLLFTLQNDPILDTFIVYFETESYTESFRQKCGFVAFPVESGIKAYISGNALGDKFVISSFSVKYRISTTLKPNIATTTTQLTPTINPINTQTSSTPTRDQTPFPTLYPTPKPSSSPTISADVITSTAFYPTFKPTIYPTAILSVNPSKSPTKSPLRHTTDSTIMLPSHDTTTTPSNVPTFISTSNPTLRPTANPTLNPTLNPTRNPTLNPTANPTFYPTLYPTLDPTTNPTFNPTSYPTLNPIANPTLDATSYPTFNPTLNPTLEPTIIATSLSSHPTLSPFSATSNITHFNISTSYASTTIELMSTISIATIFSSVASLESLGINDVVIPIICGLIVGVTAAICVIVAVMRQYEVRKIRKRFKETEAAHARSLSKEEAVAFRGHRYTQVSGVSSTCDNITTFRFESDAIQYQNVEDQSIVSVNMSSIQSIAQTAAENNTQDEEVEYKHDEYEGALRRKSLLALPEDISTSHDSCTDTDDIMLPKPDLHIYDSNTSLSQCTEEKYDVLLDYHQNKTSRGIAGNINTNSECDPLNSTVNDATVYSEFGKSEIITTNQEIQRGNWNTKDVPLAGLSDMDYTSSF